MVACAMLSCGLAAGGVRHVTSSRRIAFIAKCTSGAALFLVYVFYISISFVFFQTFQCITLSDGSRYLSVDLSVSCLTAEYNRHYVLAMIGVLVFVAGVPAMIVALLWPHRDALSGTTIEHVHERMTNDNIRSLRFLWRNVRRCIS